MTDPTLGPAWASIIVRELDRLIREVEAYPDEADLWRTPGSVKNSAGTLALHLAGNLEHFVGSVLGETGYVRDREGEFGDRDVPRAEIVRRIRACQKSMRDTLEGMTDEALLAGYPATLPASLGGEGTPATTFLTHLTWHLGWHLGQIDYHRRIVAGGEAV
ncbi:MAG TPA: DinB family protein [Longimicrobiales bacterium]|nr:DinB family protein [Longimicrobiales bacterium]